MVSVRAGHALLLIAALALPPAIASRTHRPPTSGHTKPKRARATTIHGQRTIDSSRATEIQAALIQQKYLSGSPTKEWDAQTQTAMQQYQADHGWQTKLVPDSRALISLGLGPAGHTSDVVAASQIHPASDAATTERAVTEGSNQPEANTLASVHSISQ
jgi:hypothetical protein